MNNQLLYTLRQLMYQKYGEAKFALGCELVARWINFEIRDIPVKKCRKWVQEDVVDLCNKQKTTAIQSTRALMYEEAEALRQLFGLASINQLYNQ